MLSVTGQMCEDITLLPRTIRSASQSWVSITIGWKPGHPTESSSKDQLTCTGKVLHLAIQLQAQYIEKVLDRNSLLLAAWPIQ